MQPPGAVVQYGRNGICEARGEQVKIVKQNGIIVPVESMMLTPQQYRDVRRDYELEFIIPYRLKLEKLKGLFDKVHSVSTQQDHVIREVLGENIIDEVIGTWGAMYLLAEGVRYDQHPSVLMVKEVVIQLVNALRTFYYLNDSSLLHRWAVQHAKFHDLPIPKIPKPQGKGKRKRDRATIWLNNKTDEMRLKVKSGNDMTEASRLVAEYLLLFDPGNDEIASEAKRRVLEAPDPVEYVRKLYYRSGQG